MEQQTKTKKALIMSVLSVFLCIAMLIGMTFAWFTDTASTGVNKIQAGNLDVALEMKNSDGNWVSAEGETLTFKTKDNRAADDILWEPGCTYELPELRVVNNGNLALKYKVEITGIKGDAKLNEVIDWTIKTGADEYNLGDERSLIAKDNADIFTIEGHMQETAGNEYQGLSIDGIAITVDATQLNHESDSNGSDYDKDATYSVAVNSADDFKEAVEAGKNVVLKDDINISAMPLTVESGKDVAIDLNGKTVTASGNFAIINAGAKLTVNNGTVVSGRYVFDSKGGEVVVNSGDFTAQESVCAMFGGSKLTINGGTFTSKDNNVIATNGSSANGCEITINGGTFNANIQTGGYIACGVYVANNDTVKINAGTFNVTDGIGVMMRAGKTTIGKNVVINLTNTGHVAAGRIGDANIDISTPGYLVVDVRSGYPHLDSDFSVTNNSEYSITEYR